MKYSYKEIQGSIVDVNELDVARAKSIALAALNNPAYILNPVFVKRIDGAEVILVTLDIEVYQNPLNGVEEQEDIAIICHPEDDSFPEVYALRNNFQLGLPHTNLRIEDYPVCLCVTEQLFQEVKHRFNPFEFIESIRQWLTLTSQDKLHAIDQPLEPFFVSKGGIIVPSNKDNIDVNNFYITPVAPNSNLFRIQKEKNADSAYFCFGFHADEQVSGFIRREPQVIKDLADFIFIKGIDLSTALSNCFNNLAQFFLEEKELLQKKVAICCGIPVKRYSKDIEPERTEELFFVTKKTVREIAMESNVWEETLDKKSIVPLLGKHFTKEIIEKIGIETYTTMIDFNRLTAAIYNNEIPNKDKFTLIGVGALGSQVLSLYARTGYGEWNIIDHDLLLPHNLARHALGRDSIGFSKVEKLAEQLNFLVGEEFCTPIKSDFIKVHSDENVISFLKESKAIIDISTSIAVGRLLARDYADKISTRRISAFLNPTGKDLVILAEDEKRRHRLDFLEMEYYRFLYKNENLHDHLIFNDDFKIRLNRNSCREISSRINQTDISMLSSICAKSIRKIVEHRDASIAVWRINDSDCTIQQYTTAPTKWEKVYSNEWKIYLNNQLLDEMRSLRTQKLPKETGGVLLGSIDMERKIIYIYDTIAAPEDSDETTSSFERGIEGVLEEYNKYRTITDNQIQYLGEWHSHPKGCSTNPSELDKKLFAYLADKLLRQGYPTIMGILGDNNCGFTISF
ncbi:ThiF family adenylyltransferase [Massilibacteroides vaginae]|uniref:ThiF family adenylyltransferase n=1 Tax=Massilibacteroides vaginae TaxID=1673718 RepID=UPI000A1C7B6E|nr:ThiF family adenylyltransferase [Massilibacteroides vaginae]